MLKRSGVLSGSRSQFQRPLFNLDLGRVQFCLGKETKIMGVLNVTPDSFSDGGLFEKPKSAVARALKMEEEGAHLIDIGGESSRPGARPVSSREEIRRIRPVLKSLARRSKLALSVDTYKSEVARMALDEGAVLLNDIYALRQDKKLAKLIARYKAGVVLMHMQGTPQTMQKKPFYKKTVQEITSFLRTAVDRALSAGISKSSILLDPGFGFGKTKEQNLEILSSLEQFSKLRYPVLAGLSRKSFIGHILGAPAEERLFGSLAAASLAIDRGAHILRVHDVLAHQHLSKLTDAVLLPHGN